MDILKKYKHNPPHAFIPNAAYFITASTYLRKRLLTSDVTKEKLLEYMIKTLDTNKWVLEDWVILDNHYHMMLKASEYPDRLSNIMRDIHKFSALWIKKNIKETGSLYKIWHNYWDSCITYEKSYFARLNYIWFNPVKHGYVEDPKDWKFGSYFYRYKDEQNYMENIRIKYPYDKAKIKDDF
jgi:putative transposase